MLVYLTRSSFTVVFFLEILKKALKIKKNSDNDQLSGHFQSCFIYFVFRPPTLNLKMFSRKSTNINILALAK